MKTDTSLSTSVPAVGGVHFGDFLRLQPISRHWGYDRGQPIDRLYIETFLQQHCSDIRGRVLEAGDRSYTLRFGGAQVTKPDVLHVDTQAPGATIIADLSSADHIGSELFDCIVLTQTLQYVFDLGAAIRTLQRILKPEGVLLLTVPGIGQTDHDRWGEVRFWSFTAAGLRRLLLAEFPSTAVHVQTRGNVLTATAFLQGLAQEDIPSPHYLAADDPHYPLTILARAVKSPADTTSHS